MKKNAKLSLLQWVTNNIHPANIQAGEEFVNDQKHLLRKHLSELHCSVFETIETINSREEVIVYLQKTYSLLFYCSYRVNLYKKETDDPGWKNQYACYDHFINRSYSLPSFSTGVCLS